MPNSTTGSASGTGAEDGDAAIREMMGFSSFGGTSSTKRRKTQDQTVASSPGISDPSSSNLPSQSHLSFLPASLPPRPQNTSSANINNAGDFSPDAFSYNNVGPYPQAIFQSQPLTKGLESLPPQPPASASMASDSAAHAPQIYSSNDIRSDPSYWSTNQSTPRDSGASFSSHNSHRRNQRGNFHNAPRHHQQADNLDENEVAYCNPHTGITFTRGELNEYSKGKKQIGRDGNEVTVFFMPEFVREGLWDRWEGEKKASTTQEKDKQVSVDATTEQEHNDSTLGPEASNGPAGGGSKGDAWAD